MLGKDRAVPDVKVRETSAQDIEKTMSGLSMVSNEGRRSSARSEEERTADQKRFRNKYGLSLTLDDLCKAVK